MPSVVIPVVLSNLDKFSDKDLYVLIEDVRHQAKFGSFGDEQLDVPIWTNYAEKLTDEYLRRKSVAK